MRTSMRRGYGRRIIGFWQGPKGFSEAVCRFSSDLKCKRLNAIKNCPAPAGTNRHRSLLICVTTGRCRFWWCNQVICNLWNGSFFCLRKHEQRQKMATSAIPTTPATTDPAMMALSFCLDVTPTEHTSGKWWEKGGETPTTTSLAVGHFFANVHVHKVGLEWKWWKRQ